MKSYKAKELTEPGYYWTRGAPIELPRPEGQSLSRKRVERITNLSFWQIQL